MNKPENTMSIAAVARETAIAKEVLRKWEERYGFPSPARDGRGNRLYAANQVSRLVLIKKLIDNGMRPAHVVALPGATLKALAATNGMNAHHPGDGISAKIVPWLKLRSPSRLRTNLQAMLTRVGLEKFVVETMPAMNRNVGKAWECGGIAVHDEHVYSEVIQDILRDAIKQIRPAVDAPKALLTTPFGEMHALGILMLQAFLTLHGVSCVSLGAQTPDEEVAQAAGVYNAEIVCLSFSASFSKRKALAVIRNVRSLIDRERALWVGGEGVNGLARTPHGVRVFNDFTQVASELKRRLKTRS
jgi:methanogenic corrinoid protein MtbC1